MSTHFEKNKSIANYGRLKYDQIKEKERLFLLKKQNLTEIKMLIDRSVKSCNKTIDNMIEYKNSMKKKENNIILKNIYMKKKGIEYVNKEKKEEEIDLIKKKHNEKSFKKMCEEQRRLDEEKKIKWLEHQNALVKNQIEWENKYVQRMDKVKNIYNLKHNLAIKEYMSILEKDIIRDRKINQKRDELELKSKIEDERRDQFLINYKNLSNNISNYVRTKFERRQKHISDFLEEQKRIRIDNINLKKQKRMEKIERNSSIRQLKEEQSNQRRKMLREQFEINDEKVRLRKNLIEKKNEDKKLINDIKFGAVVANFVEIKNMLNHKNMKKMQKMKTKEKEIEEKIQLRKLFSTIVLKKQTELKERKVSMINHLNQIMDNKKIKYNLQDVYKKVFSDEELKLFNAENNDNSNNI